MLAFCIHSSCHFVIVHECPEGRREQPRSTQESGWNGECTSSTDRSGLACFDFHFDGFEELVFETEKNLGKPQRPPAWIVAKPKDLVATKSKQQTLQSKQAVLQGRQCFQELKSKSKWQDVCIGVALNWKENSNFYKVFNDPDFGNLFGMCFPWPLADLCLRSGNCHTVSLWTEHIPWVLEQS